MADPYVAQVRAFSDAVRGAPWTGATIADGLRVMEWHSAALARKFADSASAARARR